MTKTNKPLYTLLVGTDAINAAIKSIANRGKLLDRDIQIAALSAMQHHVEHGDVTLINRLIENMPKGSRVNALRQYIEWFGAVAYDADTKKFVHVKGKTFDINAASEKMWTVFKHNDGDYVGIENPIALLQALTKKFEKDIAELGDKSKVDPTMLTLLRSAVVNQHAI